MNRLIGCILFLILSLSYDHAISYQSESATINWDNLPGAYSVRNYTVKDGLPINSVNYLSTSQAGYMYMATNDGLVRFDGRKFHVYNSFNTPALRSNRIAWVGAFADEIWLTDDQRNVYRLRDGKIKCLQDLAGMENVEGYKISRYDDQTILITTNAGFFVVDTGVFEFDRFDDPRTYVHFNNSFSFGRDSVYFIDEAGLFIIKNEQVHLVHSATDFTISLESVFNLIPTANNQIWLLSDNGWITKVTENEKPESFFLKENVEFRDAIERPENRLLLSSNKGYYYFDQDRNTFRETNFVSDSEPYFEDNAWNTKGMSDELITVFNNTIYVNDQKVLSLNRPISYLMKDAEGSIWVATNGGGVFQILKNKMITIGTDVHPGLDNVYGLNEVDGAIWVTAFNNYLYSITDKEIHNWNNENAGFNEPFFRTVEKTSDGNIFAGSFDLWRKNSDTWKKIKFSDQNGLINVLFEDSSNRLWIGAGYGLYRMENDVSTAFKDIDSVEIGSVQSIRELNDGTLLFATKEFGVAILDEGGRFRFINEQSGLSSNIVRDVVMVGSDTLWVATEDKGLNRIIVTSDWKSKETQILTTNDGLKDNSLHRIILDEFGYMWLNSNRGIMRFSYQNVNDYLDGKTRLNVQHFSENDGLTNIEGNGGAQNAGIITTDGKLLFPNQAGLVYTRPEWHLSAENESPYQIIIEEVNIADSSFTYNIGSGIELPKRVRELSIDFTLPSFTAQDKLQFEYKLEGVNTDWVSVGNERSAIFSNLPSGTHTLQIRGHIQGLETTAQTAVSIIVPALFRESSMFVFLVIIVMIGAFFGFLKIAMQQAKKRELRLNAIVTERTEEVVREKEKTEQALKQLEELSESRSRFFTNFTHELRTPLTLILNPLDDIVKKRSADVSENNQSLLLVRRNAQRLRKLVNTLLDVSKLNSNQLSITFSPIRIVDITKQIAAQFEHEFNNKNITFKISASDENTILYVDVNAWDHICTNLIGNAIKFTERGGEISVQFEQTDKEVVIKFSDTGIGIPEAELSHIFDIYYQGESLITRAGGTGIGLTLVKGFVEKLKGKISVQSKVGQGTQFAIKLPLGKSHLSTSDTVVEQLVEQITDKDLTPKVELNLHSNNGSVNKRRIVLVEDNEDMREYIAHVISSEYEVRMAPNGKEGLKVIKEFSPELIVSDIMMPEMDGIEMMKHIRKEKRYQHIPFVFLSAKDSAADIEKGLNLGADVYLTKPIENNELLLQIKVLLRRESNIAKPKETEIEHPFIEQLTAVVSRHLGNPDLSIELLAEALAMSESTLYRKWRKISKTSINKTIARLRFEEAIKLIQEEGITISEAAFAVGFRHLSYFSSAFKKEYGISPQEYFK